MLILCPRCVSSYKIEPATLARGGALHCAHCRQPLHPAAATPSGAVAKEGPGHDGSARAGVGLALCVLSCLSGLLAWRAPIARHVPGAAALYRAAGLITEPASLVVSGLTSERTPDGLAVEGTLSNPGSSRMPVPRLRLAIRDAGSATLASWTTEAPKRSLGPGETVIFTSRLDKLPAEGHDLSVSFAAERVAVSDAGVKEAR